MLLDEEATIKFLNHSPVGIEKADVIGKNWFSLITKDQREDIKKIFVQLMQDGKPISYEYLGRGAHSKPTWYWTRFTALLNDEGKITGAILISRDQSEKKEAEALLIETERMASIGTLVAGVAHEINNPLASVILNLEIILNECTNSQTIPAKLVNKLHETYAAVENIQKIVIDLKLLSHREEDPKTSVDLAKVLDSSLRIALNENRRPIEIVKNYSQSTKVLANEGRLGQVFLNLIINAAQALRKENPRNRIEVTASIQAEQVIVSIKDNGIGMSEPIKKRIFTPFFTTKPKGIGTGLALPLTKRIVKNLGGDITFTSTLNSGTEFIVSLPLAPPENLAHAEEPGEIESSSQQSKLLIVDDEETFSSVLEEVLADDHEVTTVNCGADAIALLSEGKRYNVIVSDLMMPQMSGMELYKKVLELAPDQAQRMVFMTGGAFGPSTSGFLESIDNKKIEKPFKLKELRKLLSSVKFR